MRAIVGMVSLSFYLNFLINNMLFLSSILFKIILTYAFLKRNKANISKSRFTYTIINETVLRPHPGITHLSDGIS